MCGRLMQQHLDVTIPHEPAASRSGPIEVVGTNVPMPTFTVSGGAVPREA